MAPDVLTLAFWLMMAPFVMVSEVKGTPPTTPFKVTVPPVPPLRLKTCEPDTVLEKVILFPAAAVFVVSAITEPVSVTGPVIAMTAPCVVRLPPNWIVDAVYEMAPTVDALEPCTTVAPVAVNEVNGVPPTAPERVTVLPEPPVKVRFFAPVKVLEKVMLAPVAVAPPLVVSAVTSVVKVAPFAIEIVPPFVVRLPPKFAEPV